MCVIKRWMLSIQLVYFHLVYINIKKEIFYTCLCVIYSLLCYHNSVIYANSQPLKY